MRWKGPKKKWVLSVLLACVICGLLRQASFVEGPEPIYREYLNLEKPSAILHLNYPPQDKWDLEYVLGTYSEHRSITLKSQFAFPSTYSASCSHPNLPVNKPCIDPKCESSFPKELEKNIEKVESYPSNGVEEIRQKMLVHIATQPPVRPDNIIIVSATSSDYYYASQGLLKMLHDKLMIRFSNIHMIMYDMGLTPCQRKLMEKYCRCQVKRFPFEIFPSHVKKNLKSYAWKPLLIQLELLQHRFITYMDSSIRLQNNDYQKIFQQGIDRGISIAYGEFPFAQQTDLQMFQWFQEKPCLFSNFYEVQPGFMMLYRNDFVQEKIMNPWVACALSESCILPTRAVYDCDSSVRRYGKCHRHDQSAISIILTRLFQQSRELLHLTRYKLKKRENVHYFPEEPSWLCRF